MAQRWQMVLAGGLGVFVLVVLGWQTLVLIELRHKVTELEQRVGEEQPVARESTSLPREQRGGARVHVQDMHSDQAVGVFQSSPGRDETAAMLDVAVEEALDRRDQDRTIEKAEQWAEFAEARIGKVVGEAVDESLIPAHLEAQVIELLLAEVQHTSQLKVDVSEGERTTEEAMAAHETSRQKTEDALFELIGEDAAEELAGRMRQGRFGGK